MKIIVVGLGNFGSALSEKLTLSGQEVLGVDTDMERVEALKQRISHTMCLDCRDQEAARTLPLKDTDVVIVCIGEDEGANLMVTAVVAGRN